MSTKSRFYFFGAIAVIVVIASVDGLLKRRLLNRSDCYVIAKIIRKGKGKSGLSYTFRYMYGAEAYEAGVTGGYYGDVGNCIFIKIVPEKPGICATTEYRVPKCLCNDSVMNATFHGTLYWNNKFLCDVLGE